MRPYQPGESLYNLIKQAVPNFVESDYPLFIEFLTAYLRFLEQQRTFVDKTVSPEYGTVPDSTVQITNVFGGPLYEARKFLEYKDVDTTLEEFKTQFLDTFARRFPQYSYVPVGFLVRMLRQFYQSKGTVDSLQWFFRVLFNQHADVYFPREDILKASDATWVAPITIKVSAPVDGHSNADVTKFYIGQRVVTATGSALVETLVTSIVGQAYNQNIVVNELHLKFDSILGTFAPGQILSNIDSTEQVRTTILPVIADVTVDNGGSNYAVGDTVIFSEGPGGGYGYGAFGVVSQVSNTAINGVAVVDGGDGFITGLPCVFISTTGHGAAAVIQDVSYGNFLLEDGSGFLLMEDGLNRLELEDVNVIFLELVIDPFVNATASIQLTNPNYGTAASVPQLNGVTYDSQISLAFAAVDQKPFMHPWVFTNQSETNAALANASCNLTLTANTSFANGATIFSLTSLQDLATNTSTASITANVIVAQVAQGGLEDTLYLKDFTGLNQLQVGTIFKDAGAGVLQLGTVSCDGSANLVGNGTAFLDTTQVNTHLRFQNGTKAVVKQVVNNTLLVAYSALGGTLVANTYSVVPVGTVDSVTAQAQRFYGKITSVRLLSAGGGYATPPAITVDSVSARAQELFYLDPGIDQTVGTGDDTIVAAANQINVFRPATLQAEQDSGQVQKVKITNSGVNYLDANSVVISAVHGAGRSGANAAFTPVIEAITKYPGQFTTTRSFLSSDKYLQDLTLYNDFTYVIRVAESFDRYRELLLNLVHPSGFQPVGQFVETESALLSPLDSSFDISVQPPQGANQTITMAVGGTVSLSGVLAPKNVTKPLAAVVTPHAAVVKAITKPTAGSMTLTGSVKRFVSKALVASVPTAGAMQKFVTKPTFTGSITPSGVANRSVNPAGTYYYGMALFFPTSGSAPTSGYYGLLLWF